MAPQSRNMEYRGHRHISSHSFSAYDRVIMERRGKEEKRKNERKEGKI